MKTTTRKTQKKKAGTQTGEKGDSKLETDAVKAEKELKKSIHRVMKLFCDKHIAVFGFGYNSVSKVADIQAIRGMIKAYGEENLTKAVQIYVDNYKTRYSSTMYRTPKVLGLKIAAPNIVHAIVSGESEQPTQSSQQEKNPFEDDWL